MMMARPMHVWDPRLVVFFWLSASTAMSQSVRTAASHTDDLLSNLERAAALFKDGLLTAEEFSTTKQRFLAPSLPLKTFGTGRSAMIINATEQVIFEHSVPNGTIGVMTHFWITGMEVLVSPSLLLCVVDLSFCFVG